MLACKPKLFFCIRSSSHVEYIFSAALFNYSTHSYKPGTRFGPNAIRDAFNNIEVFHPKLGVDLEEIPVHDLGNIQHTVDVFVQARKSSLIPSLALILHLQYAVCCQDHARVSLLGPRQVLDEILQCC